MGSPFAPIPMPMNGMDAFMSGMQSSQAMFDSMMKNKMTPYQIELLKAQALEAQGKAKAEGMAGDYIQNLMNPGMNRPSINEPLTGTETPGGFDNSGNQIKYNTARIPVGESSSSSDVDRESWNLPKEYKPSVNDNGAPLSIDDGYPIHSIAEKESSNLNNNAQLGQEKVIFAGDSSKYQQDEAAKQGLEMNVGGISIKPKIERKTENGYEITTWPSGKKTISKVGQNEEEKQLSEAKGKAAAKELENVVTTQASTQGISTSLEGLKDLMKNPRYKNIAGTAEAYALNLKPFGLPVGAGLSKAFPNKFPKEDLDLLGQANAYMGNINIAAGQLFKGSYKNMIDGLIGSMKPNVSDPESVQNGKIRGIETLMKIGQQRNALVEKYVGEGMAPGMANLRADKEIPFSEVKKQVTNAQNPNEKNMISVRDNHTGKIIKMTRAEYDDLVKE